MSTTSPWPAPALPEVLDQVRRAGAGQRSGLLAASGPAAVASAVGEVLAVALAPAAGGLGGSVEVVAPGDDEVYGWTVGAGPPVATVRFDHLLDAVLLVTGARLFDSLSLAGRCLVQSQHTTMGGPFGVPGELGPLVHALRCLAPANQAHARLLALAGTGDDDLTRALQPGDVRALLEVGARTCAETWAYRSTDAEAAQGVVVRWRVPTPGGVEEMDLLLATDGFRSVPVGAAGDPTATIDAASQAAYCRFIAGTATPLDQFRAGHLTIHGDLATMFHLAAEFF